MLLGLLAFPPAYFAMKRAAIQRHLLWQHWLEDGAGDLTGTWHAALIDLVYPL